MANSILDTVKQVCGIEPDYTHYDVDILMHINSVFATLNQLGIGPDDGFEISDATTEWSVYLESNKLLNSVKTYVCLKVRSIFDPPQTSYHINAMNEQLRELEWRINVVREHTEWTDPTPAEDPEDLLILDGGPA